MFKRHSFSYQPRVELIRCFGMTHAFHRHIHTSLNVGMVIKGERAMTFNKMTYRIQPGECFIISPFQPHACVPGNGRDLDYVVLSMDMEYVQSVLPASRDNILNCHVVKDSSMCHQLISLCDHVDKNQPDLWEKIVCEMLRGLYSQYGVKQSGQRHLSGKIQTAQQIRQYLDAHYDEPIQTSDLSGLFKKSPFHLNRTFREIVGVPPHHYLQLTRLRKAKEMILKGESLVQAALQAGFSDQPHFTRLFKQYMGITPGIFSKS